MQFVSGHVESLKGNFCDYVGEKYGGKKRILTGPVLPEPGEVNLEDKWEKWLAKFDPGSVVYCAFGTQVTLEKKQFQELVLGLELTGLPFLVALKTPYGVSSIEEALPEGFQERIGERGGDLWGNGDQIPNARLLAEDLGVAIEVERDENGGFSKEDVSKAVLNVMDNDSKLGQTIRNNHQSWMETILKPNWGVTI
ncbi:hypothetical protein Leryth_016483 [Lithospermum erythrorhizon]|nr:hypothetical protein Leryth_016483 [Lithospermum erythrorhizon]